MSKSEKEIETKLNIVHFIMTKEIVAHVQTFRGDQHHDQFVKSRLNNYKFDNFFIGSNPLLTNLKSFIVNVVVENKCAQII